MTEEERAAAYREQCERRKAFRQQQCRELAGDPDRAQAVRDAWQPLLDALEERRLDRLSPPSYPQRTVL